MSDIFICYSRTDATVAETLAERLEAQGWSVYRDVKTQVGKSWHEEIEAELHASKAVIVLWSSKSRGSHEVLDEARYAKDNGKLFPVLIQQILRPLGFGGIQTADLIGWTGEQEHPGLTQLFTALRLHLNVGETRPASIDPAQPPATQPGAAQAPTARISTEQTFRDKLKSGGEGPLMEVIPAGRFLMGSPPDESARGDREGPQHEVRIAESFAMGVYAVTFEEYDRFCDATNQEKPQDKNWGRGKQPVINVSWDDAKTYCRWLTEQSGRAYRLPSEAEWEYACRARTSTPFNFLPSMYPSDVMPGKVWEWCQDYWHKNYRGAPNDGSPWEEPGGATRVLRGGSWFFDATLARLAARNHSDPDNRSNSTGFRVLCVSPIE